MKTNFSKTKIFLPTLFIPVVLLTALMIVPLASCGVKEEKENRELRKTNDQLRHEAEQAKAKEATSKEETIAEQKRAEEAQKRADETETVLRQLEADLKKASDESLRLLSEMSALEEDARRLRNLSTVDGAFRNELRTRFNLPTSATDADIQAAIDAKIEDHAVSINILEAEIKKLKLVSKNELALSPFSGIWIAEENPAVILPAGCNLMLVVTSSEGTISRAVVCDDGNAQIETMTPKEYGVRGDLFPSSLGFEVVGEVTNSTCGDLTSSILGTKTFIFDYSTSAGAEKATYMFASYGESENVVFQSGSSLTALERNKSCEVITARAAAPEHQANAILQKAAKLCSGMFAKTGCFTADGFKPVAQ
jgi:hypothetical protein